MQNPDRGPVRKTVAHEVTGRYNTVREPRHGVDLNKAQPSVVAWHLPHVPNQWNPRRLHSDSGRNEHDSIQMYEIRSLLKRQAPRRQHSRKEIKDKGKYHPQPKLDMSAVEENTAQSYHPGRDAEFFGKLEYRARF